MPEALPTPDSDAPDGTSPTELPGPAIPPAPAPANAPPAPRGSSPQSGGLWSAERRPLTVGLVLTITLVAAEALAVSTAMPIVAADLGGLELYGLVFSAFLVGSLFGIVLTGTLIDGRGLLVAFAFGLGLFTIGLALAGVAVSMPM